MRFDEDYFERGAAKGVSLYSHYRWLPEMTIPMAHEIVTALGIRRVERILDFGCAKGFLVKALRLLHFDAYGFDVSEYALSAAPDDVKPFLSGYDTPPEALGERASFDWIVSKDVLEHVSHDEIGPTLTRLADLCRQAFVIVPLGNGTRYNCPEYEQDVTHVIRQDVAWWARAFLAAGFTVTSVTTDMPFIKRARCNASDAFFVLRSRQ